MGFCYKFCNFSNLCNKIEIMLEKSKQVTIFEIFLVKDIAITVFAYFFY